MQAVELGSRAYLEELRAQLTGRLAVLPLAVAGCLAAWRIFVPGPFSDGLTVCLLSLVVLSWSVRWLLDRYPSWARHVLVWSLVGGLLIAMWSVADYWLPFLGLPLIFLSAMLVSGGELAVAVTIGGMAGWLVHSAARLYPMPALIGGLLFASALAWLTVRALYTALEWAWSMHLRADRLLEQARDHQGELGRALNSLDKTNWILRRTQREVVAARRQAEEARLMKEQFAANVSHELRTPLNLILGFSEIMSLSPEVYGEVVWSATLRQDINQIYRSSRHLLEMIDDILDLSRFEITGFTLNKELAALPPLLIEATAMAGDLFRSRPIRLETDIADNLPMLEVDRIRIRQVLLNLLANAARFTEEGAVRLEARLLDAEVAVSVRDTGPGIPTAELPNLFNEFYQADRSLHRKHSGAGLGLAISKRFVEAHHGRIWAESEEGHGATFTFTLPVPGEYVVHSDLHFTQSLRPAAPDARPTVLLLDADPTVARVVDRRLEGYEIVQVEDTDQMQEQIASLHPRAVICNVLPDGDAQLGALSATGGPASYSVPMIECSLPSQAWVANDLGVASYLAKPLTAERLLHELHRLGVGKDVLIVDDDRGFCRLVERMLEASGNGYRVCRAYDGESGLRSLRERHTDVVLLDLVMPQLDGLGMVERMRGDPELANIPVVVVTATHHPDENPIQHSSHLTVRRAGGLRLAELLRCLDAVIGSLEATYSEPIAVDEGG